LTDDEFIYFVDSIARGGWVVKRTRGPIIS
jgi:hypothetical protein